VFLIDRAERFRRAVSQLTGSKKNIGTDLVFNSGKHCPTAPWNSTLGLSQLRSMRAYGNKLVGARCELSAFAAARERD